MIIQLSIYIPAITRLWKEVKVKCLFKESQYFSNTSVFRYSLPFTGTATPSFSFNRIDKHKEYQQRAMRRGRIGIILHMTQSHNELSIENHPSSHTHHIVRFVDRMGSVFV